MSLETVEDECNAIRAYDKPLIKQAYLDSLLPEIEATLLNNQPPARIARDRQLKIGQIWLPCNIYVDLIGNVCRIAYECGDARVLASTLTQVGLDTAHGPIDGDAGSQLDEALLFGRNRRMTKVIVDRLQAELERTKDQENPNDSQPPLFVVDAANVLAVDRFDSGKQSIVQELTTRGFRLTLLKEEYVLYI